MLMCYCKCMLIFKQGNALTISYSHAVRIGILPMVERRLDAEERVNVKPGSIYIWEERGSPLEVTGMGIERW